MWFHLKNYQAHARSARARRACALRALGLLLADGPGPLSFWVIFLIARTVPPSFVEIGPKLRVVALLTRQWPKTAKNRGEPQKMTPSSETENFLGVVPMGKLEPRV